MALPIKTLQDKDGTDFQPLIDGQTMVGDYTQKGTSGTLGTQYTAPSNGWVYVCLRVNGGNNRTAKLTVGEKDYPVAISGQNEANYSSSVCIPVLKGDTYTASSTDSLATGGGIWFLPSRT